MCECSPDYPAQVMRCKGGNGVDRHLQGLQWMEQRRVEQGEKPSGFYQVLLLRAQGTHSRWQSAAWKKLGESMLSTSQMTAQGVVTAGFGAVNPLGLGLGYSIFPNNVGGPLARAVTCRRFRVRWRRTPSPGPSARRILRGT